MYILEKHIIEKENIVGRGLISIHWLDGGRS